MDLGHDLSQALMHGVDFLGELSFGRRRYSRDLTGVDMAVVGVTFDGGTVNRPGARFGPRAIREQTSLVGCYPWGPYPWDHNIFDRHEVIDWSDVAFTTAYPERMCAAVRTQVGGLVEAGVSVLTLGGDHMVTYPLLEAHHAHLGTLALVHFDAHSDTWGMGDDLNHGTWGYLAQARGLVDPARSVQIGMRSPNPETYGFTILKRVGKGPTYLTFDIDFLDPAYAPGTGTPVPGGMSSYQALAIIRALKGLDLVGMDVVEVSPPYDHADLTSMAAAHFVWTYLCGQVSRRASRRAQALVHDMVSGRPRRSPQPPAHR